MRGHVRKRGNKWLVVVDAGRAPARRCAACSSVPRQKALWWVETESLAACPRCGGPLVATTARKQNWLSFNSQAEADAELAKTLVRINERTYVEPSKRTLGAFLHEEWLPAIASSIRPTTSANYRVMTDAYIFPRIGGVKLQALTPGRLQGFYAELLERGGRGGTGLAPKTVRNVQF